GGAGAGAAGGPRDPGRRIGSFAARRLAHELRPAGGIAFRRRGRARAGGRTLVGDGVAGTPARPVPAARGAGWPHETRVAGKRYDRHRPRPGDLLRGLGPRSQPVSGPRFATLNAARWSRRKPRSWESGPWLGASPRSSRFARPRTYVPT